jgi:hypothetical protein
VKLLMTDESVAALSSPKDKPQSYYWDTERLGFGVVVGKTGSKTFVARALTNGEYRKFTIGKFDDGWSVDRARQRASEVIAEVAKGKIPHSKRARRDEAQLGRVVAVSVYATYDSGFRQEIFRGAVAGDTASGLSIDRTVAVWVDLQDTKGSPF